MSLFVCSKCGCIENTALCLYWTQLREKEKLCSECDPKIGIWHGIFKKEKYNEQEWEYHSENFVGRKAKGVAERPNNI